LIVLIILGEEYKLWSSRNNQFNPLLLVSSLYFYIQSRAYSFPLKRLCFATLSVRFGESFSRFVIW
jgi:hypothetical protein